MITKERLKQIKQIFNAAQKSIWRERPTELDRAWSISSDGLAAIQSIPELLNEIRELRARLEERERPKEEMEG